MSEVLQGPLDNRPEVEVISHVYTFRTGPDDGLPEHYEERVKYEAHCRFGCGTRLSPNVVDTVNYVNEHMASYSHFLAKQERLSNDN